MRLPVSCWPIVLNVIAGPDVRYGEAKPTLVLRCNRRILTIQPFPAQTIRIPQSLESHLLQRSFVLTRIIGKAAPNANDSLSRLIRSILWQALQTP